MAWVTKRGEYPRALKCLAKMVSSWLRSSGSEQILAILRAWEYGMLLHVCGGWQLCGHRYIFVSVGLV